MWASLAIKSQEKKITYSLCTSFSRFSDSSKPNQFVLLIYEFTWLAGIGKSEENWLKTSCKDDPVAKVAHIL